MAHPIKVNPTAPSSYLNSGPREIASGHVASISSQIVQEASTNNQSYFDNYAFSQRRKIQLNKENENHNSFERRRHFGPFNAPTETFVAIMELGFPNSFFDTNEEKPNKKASLNISKAVYSYEVNLSITTNAASVLGSELSILL